MNITLHIEGKPVTLESLERKAQAVTFTLSGKSYTFRSHHLPDGGFILERKIDASVWQRINGDVWQSGKDKRVQIGKLEAKITEAAANASHADLQLVLSPPAPMPGLVRQICVKVGERVIQGQSMVVMEAMKLQITLAAGGDATVDKILVREGDMVSEGVELVRLK